MDEGKKFSPEEISNIWRMYLTSGDVPDTIDVPWHRSKRLRSLYHLLPQNPRCRVCHSPFKGLGGLVFRSLMGIQPSRLNPDLCNECEVFAQQYHGGAEVELTILFADVRGSSALAEQMNPTEFSRLINRFYNAATKVLFGRRAMVEKLIGDEVTAFFTQGVSGEQHAKVAIESARQILHETGHQSAEGPWIPVGIGVHTGLAYVGSVDSDYGFTDIAVLGDTVNIGARLAALARPGEIYASQAAAQAAGLDPAGARIHQQPLKGRSEPIEVWVLGG